MTNFNPVELLKSQFTLRFNEPLDISIILQSRYDDLYSLINILYAQNDIKRAIIASVKLLTIFPKRIDIYYVLYLMFENEPISYLFYKNYAIHSNDIDVLKEAYAKSKSVTLIDALYFIKRIEKKENTHNILNEKIWLLDSLYRNTKDRSFYIRGIYASIEKMEYDGLDDILKYESELSTQGMKRAIKIVYRILKKKMDYEYLRKFLVICFNYGEYEIFLEFCNKVPVDIETRLRVLIALEEIGVSEDRFESDNQIWFNVKVDYEHEKSTIKFEPENALNIYNLQETSSNCVSTLKDELINADDIFDAYIEYIIDHSKYILTNKTQSSIPILFFLKNPETYNEIYELHFILFDVLLKKRKFEKLRVILNGIITKLCMFNKRIEEISINDLESYKLTGELQEITMRFKTLFSMSLYYKETNRIDKAVFILTYLNSFDDSNDEVKIHLNQVYSRKGEDENALIFEQITRRKNGFKLNSENVNKIRKKFNQLYKFYETNRNCPNKMCVFLRESTDLLKDFFNNEYIFKEYEVKKTSKKNGLRIKRRRISVKNLDLDDSKPLSKRDKRLFYRELRDFHGLSFEEWCFLVRINFFILLGKDDYKKAIEMIKNFVKGNYSHKHLRKHAKKAIKVGLIGLKHCLLYGDYDSFVYITNNIFYQPYNFLNFFSNFFPNYYENKDYKIMSRNLLRLLIRKDDELNILFGDNKDLHKKCVTEDNELYKSLEENRKRSFLASLYPRNLHKRTIKVLLNMRTDNLEDTITLSVLLLNHSLSKRDKNVAVHAKKGFYLLLNAKTDKTPVLYYNIGRAYHMFGILGLAEFYYKKAIPGKEVRKYALFNLLIIYKSIKLEEIYFRYEKMFFEENK